MMNLKLGGSKNPLRFVSARYDGTDLQTMTECCLGSGHPALHPNGRQIVTDAYTAEPVAFDDGSVPIRLIDLEDSSDTTLVRIPSQPDWRGNNGEFRVDPHPAWDRSWTRVVFNGYVDGTRRVFLADLSTVLHA